MLLQYVIKLMYHISIFLGVFYFDYGVLMLKCHSNTNLTHVRSWFISNLAVLQFVSERINFSGTDFFYSAPFTLETSLSVKEIILICHQVYAPCLAIEM